MHDARSLVATYLKDMAQRRATGAASKETTYYTPFENLLNAVGAGLRPKVLCTSQLAGVGGSKPDFGLFAVSQLQKGEPKPGALPERGAVEAKAPGEAVEATAEDDQVKKYLGHYGLVLVTNYRDFLLLERGPAGEPVRCERFTVAPNEKAFWTLCAAPEKAAEALAVPLVEYLTRVLAHQATLNAPKDVAWLLASYARQALAQVEGQPGLPALREVKKALEEGLGIAFEAGKGLHFFHSTLVQTLFYGVFSAWVLWAREDAHKGERFDWRDAAWYLRVPMLQALFEQVAAPSKLRGLGLVEVLDWTGDALNRVDREAFFARFAEDEAVQYFYEPFLEQFNPQLRKDLGVWYTPNEVVRYMVERVDRALRDDLGIADGLADESVHVLDPCCGTGAFLVEVLRKIDATLSTHGLGAMKGAKVRKALVERIHGFEIMPAPFVVAHLQAGLFLQSIQAPLKEGERAGVYLTNALTGWYEAKQAPLPGFPELAEERDKAIRVKRDAPVLVVLGNPPYNGYPGVSGHDEERDLTEAYRRVKRVRPPEGQGLNDLYVRFFRAAERRIVETSGRGVVCFISNYSWLDGLSFTGMRERFLDEFDAIRVDCLNGDKYKTGKVAPDGTPDPSIFSTGQNREGIQVGTAIATLVREEPHGDGCAIGFRHLWGRTKREELLATAEADPAAIYRPLDPPLELGLPFMPAAVAEGYFEWPSLPELFRQSFSGVKNARDDFLVAIDREILEERLTAYFDPAISHEEIRRRYPTVMQDNSRYDAETTRNKLINRGIIKDRIVRYSYRPFDTRWLYWEPETKLLDEKRSEYWPHIDENNYWLTAAQNIRKNEEESQNTVIKSVGSYHLIERASLFFPAFLSRGERDLLDKASVEGNINENIYYCSGYNSVIASDLLFHCASILHSTIFRQENGDGLRRDWPRIPLPRSYDDFTYSSGFGRRLADLLGPDQPVPGVTTGAPRPELVPIGPCIMQSADGINLILIEVAGWGYKNADGAVMPAGGQVRERAYAEDERAALAAGGEALGLDVAAMTRLLGATTFDVFMNPDVYWQNVPANVWRYKLGGYQVIKKWLSYRDRRVLGRPPNDEEIGYVQEMARRIAAILLLGPELDANYAAAKADPYPWPRGGQGRLL